MRYSAEATTTMLSAEAGPAAPAGSGPSGRSCLAHRETAVPHQGEDGDRDELPEAAAGVLGVGELGRLQHVALAAEEHGHLHRDEAREQQDQRRDRDAPLEPSQPPRAGSIHSGQIRGAATV